MKTIFLISMVAFATFVISARPLPDGEKRTKDCKCDKSEYCKTYTDGTKTCAPLHEPPVHR